MIRFWVSFKSYGWPSLNLMQLFPMALLPSLRPAGRRKWQTCGLLPWTRASTTRSHQHQKPQTWCPKDGEFTHIYGTKSFMGCWILWGYFSCQEYPSQIQQMFHPMCQPGVLIVPRNMPLPIRCGEIPILVGEKSPCWWKPPCISPPNSPEILG